MVSSVERIAYINRDKDVAKGKSRRTKNYGRPDLKKSPGMKKRDKLDDDSCEVTRDKDLKAGVDTNRRELMDRERTASLTGEVSEFGVGQQVFPVYPVARPIIGVVVGANKVEGKVYVSYNGRVVQHDPEEIQLAAGSPYFMMAGGRVASTESGKISQLFAEASANAGRCEATEAYKARLAVALRGAGLSTEESMEFATIRVAALGEIRTRQASNAMPGDPVVVMNNAGRSPGIVGIFVGMRGNKALVNCHTDWTSARTGTAAREFSPDDIVCIDTPMKRQMKPQMMVASEKAKKIARLIQAETMSKKNFYFKNERGEAAVTVAAEDGEICIIATGKLMGVTQCLYKEIVKASNISVQAEAEAFEQNAISAAQKFVREKLLPDVAEQNQIEFIKKSQGLPEMSKK
jgi:hypothetical protein